VASQGARYSDNSMCTFEMPFVETTTKRSLIGGLHCHSKDLCRVKSQI
jgi:hypothetical protein